MSNWKDRVDMDAIKARAHIKSKKMKIAHIAKEIGLPPSRLNQALYGECRSKLCIDEAKMFAKAIDLPFAEFVTIKIQKPEAKSKVGEYPFDGRIIKSKSKLVKINFSKISRELGLKSDHITTRLGQALGFSIEILDAIDKGLGCCISDIATIPKKLDMDYTPIVIKPRPFKVRPQKWTPVSQIYSDPKLDPRYHVNPVDIVSAIRETSGFENWKSLEEKPNPHIEHKIDGMVAFRYQEGHAVLFVNEYIKPDDITIAMDQIKTWGQKVTQGAKS